MTSTYFLRSVVPYLSTGGFIICTGGFVFHFLSAWREPAVGFMNKDPNGLIIRSVKLSRRYDITIMFRLCLNGIGVAFGLVTATSTGLQTTSYSKIATFFLIYQIFTVALGAYLHQRFRNAMKKFLETPS